MHSCIHAFAFTHVYSRWIMFQLFRGHRLAARKWAQRPQMPPALWTKSICWILLWIHSKSLNSKSCLNWQCLWFDCSCCKTWTNCFLPLLCESQNGSKWWNHPDSVVLSVVSYCLCMRLLLRSTHVPWKCHSPSSKDKPKCFWEKVKPAP